MSADRELLALAAKAAGIAMNTNDPGEVSAPGSVARFIGDQIYFYSTKPGEGNVLWDPRTNDGDALRLLAALPSLWQLSMKFGPMMGLEVAWGFGLGIKAYKNPSDGGRLVAIREVIFNAAVQIGRAMP